MNDKMAWELLQAVNKNTEEQKKTMKAWLNATIKIEEINQNIKKWKEVKQQNTGTDSTENGSGSKDT